MNHTSCQFRDKHTVGGIVFYKHAFLVLIQILVNLCVCVCGGGGGGMNIFGKNNICSSFSTKHNLEITAV